MVKVKVKRDRDGNIHLICPRCGFELEKEISCWSCSNLECSLIAVSNQSRYGARPYNADFLEFKRVVLATLPRVEVLT